MQNNHDNGDEQSSGSTAMAGGFFIALFGLIGFFVGALNGEVSIGALSGFALGTVIALLIWRYDAIKNRD